MRAAILLALMALPARGGRAAAVEAPADPAKVVNETPASGATPAKAVDETVLRDAVRLQGMGLAKMAEGNYAEAITHYQKIARILPDNVLPAVNLAICRFLTGDSDAALRDVRRARELAPDNPQVLFALAKILGEREGAREEWERVLDHFAETLPHDPRPWYLKAQRLEDAGQAGEGVADWQRGLQRAPDNLVLMVGLLRAAAAAGDLRATSDALYAIEDRLGGFEEPVSDFARQLREALEQDHADALAVPAVVVQNILRPGVLYQIELDFLTGRRQRAAQLFPQLDFLPPLPPSVQGGADIEIVFADATKKTGLSALPASSWLGRARVPGRDHLLAFGGDAAGVLALADGTFRWREIGAAAGALALRLDVDQDGTMM